MTLQTNHSIVTGFNTTESQGVETTVRESLQIRKYDSLPLNLRVAGLITSGVDSSCKSQIRDFFLHPLYKNLQWLLCRCLRCISHTIRAPQTRRWQNKGWVTFVVHNYVTQLWIAAITVSIAP